MIMKKGTDAIRRLLKKSIKLYFFSFIFLFKVIIVKKKTRELSKK